MISVERYEKALKSAVNFTKGDGMKYLRRYPRSEKQELREWQEIPEWVAMNIAKATTPRDFRRLIPKWLQEGTLIGNNVIQLRAVKS